MSELRFTVLGKPQPQGSMKAFLPKFSRRPIVTSDNTKLKPYRQAIAAEAIVLVGLADAPRFGEHVPVYLEVDFFFAKPPSVKKSRVLPTVKPDLDKLIRAVKDALKGIAYHDDGQVVAVMAEKFYGTPERTEILVKGVQV